MVVVTPVRVLLETLRLNTDVYMVEELRKIAVPTLIVHGDQDASASRRTLNAPGYLDPRAGALDSAVESAVRTGNLEALQQLDPILARELMATRRPAWQVRSGAMHSSRLRTEIIGVGDRSVRSS